MKLKVKAGQMTQYETEAVLMAEYKAGGAHWQWPQRAQYNSGGGYDGAFWLLYDVDGLILEHKQCPSYAAAVVRACETFFALEGEHTDFELSLISGGLLPIAALEWKRHEDYSHSIALYPCYKIEEEQQQ